MAYEKSIDIFDISRLMFQYPWLEYPDRNRELKKASAPVYLSLSCHQVPKEEFPPSPECWRQHPSRTNSVPYCYFKEPEIYTHWHTLYDQRQEREAQRMMQKMREPRCALIREELTQSLKSPREEEQLYGAQALGCLGIRDKSVIEALLQVAQTGPEKVKYEAHRALAILGCLNKDVIQALTKQLKGPNEEQKMDALRGLRVALNSWAAIPRDKRTQVGDEGTLVSVLQMLIQKSPNEVAVEAALCLGFLRPCSNTAREFLLQRLYHGLMSQRMKALRMLVKMMRVHSAEVIRAILEQLCHSCVIEHRFEATQMLKTIGLEQIQAQGLEGLIFDLLRRKIYNEPFLAMRMAVAETVEALRMKPTMLNLVEEQLLNSKATTRQEAVISLGVLGIRSPQVFHLLLDMLDTEKNQSVIKSLKETFILLASIDPWIQNKLKNKVLFVCEAPKTNEKEEPTRFRRKHENPEKLTIQDFRLAQLNPLFVAKASATSDQQKKLSAQKGPADYPTSAFPSCFSKPLKHKSQATGPWTPGIRKQLQILAKTSR
ncbi:PREDICTED: protein HEATR9 isoform X1 [Miniopterus natalensis]|uniref:protein HEATR9 isoform X1 n=1 Tax=Miniopterus natalensis TaxID=291302 RepID=UPI0007A6C70D|nr:PREDICTED: protein HEATR9 isoform X1 [Miniopterus natalensis]